MTPTPLALRIARAFTADSLGIGETFETALWRVHRYADHVVITSLMNAAKRGKKVPQWSVSSNTYDHDLAMQRLDSWGERFLEKATSDVSEVTMAALVRDAENEGLGVSMNALRGVDVKPGNFEALVIKGPNVSIKADYDDFVVEDLRDTNNEPRAVNKNRRDVPTFFVWARANANKLKNMTFREVLAAMEAQRIAYHYYLGVD